MKIIEKSDEKLYVQYGAGNKAVEGWLNFDASPTLRIQKFPLLGRILRSRLNCIFDRDVQYGDIVKGLPIEPESVDGLFCSHVLEHLSYTDATKALENSYIYLKRGGVFRVIVPDLTYYINNYNKAKLSGNSSHLFNAAHEFCRDTSLGLEVSRISIKQRLVEAFRGSGHRWMWDYHSLTQALEDHGFIKINRFNKGECEDEMFIRPEREHQFGTLANPYGLALECRKPT